MVTVLDTLRAAQINFQTVMNGGGSRHPIFCIAMEQLNNAVKAIENGKAPNDVLQENLGSAVDTGGR